MSLRNILSISVLAVATAAFASADPLLFDDFNYPTGPLDHQNGGTGWAGAWVGIPEYTVAPGSLSFCSAGDCLQQSGNRAQFTPDDLAGTNSIRTVSSLGPNGSTFWLSFLISFDGTLAQNIADFRIDSNNPHLFCRQRAGRSSELERGRWRVNTPVHPVLHPHRTRPSPLCRDAN